VLPATYFFYEIGDLGNTMGNNDNEVAAVVTFPVNMYV
jgi:hypothetical protein